MKILIIKTFPQEIKTPHLTYNVQEIGLAVALRKAGYEADVLCCADEGKRRESVVEQEGVCVTVYAWQAYHFLKNGYFREVDMLLNEYDILQTEEYNQIFSWHLAKKYPKKTVVYHGPYYCEFNKNYNRMARIFDTLFLSRYKNLGTTFLTKSRLAKEYLCGKGLTNVKAIGVGLNITFLDSKEETTQVVDTVKALRNYQGLKLLYIGVIEERRNAKFLIDVLSLVKAVRQDAKLVLVGRFGSRDYETEFKLHLESYSLQDSIVHIERMEQSQLAAIYRTCDLFLFPTRYDIYGMVLLEAMYFGMPVISTVNGGSDIMIRDGENGFLINEYEAKAWAAKVMEVVNDSLMKERVGKTATETIIHDFTWDALAERFVMVYKEKLIGETNNSVRR